MNKQQEPYDMQEIIELVKLLRNSGDKVLSASSKLSLSTVLLFNLNEAFSLIVNESDDLESSFQVCNSSKIDIFRDLKFLHDFVQKTIGLKVVFCPNSPNTIVDITKFRHLRHLELKKISVELVQGLQGIKGQLESIICSGRRSISSIHQLLGSCGSEAGPKFIWFSLKHLSLPYNALEQLDSSLELAPFLQVLDLSHNLITRADDLAYLYCLKYVNLSFNKLEAIPRFNKVATCTLQVLVLKNNYIENINGLQVLECLIELDLSYNCLTEHSALWPLESMSTLMGLLLEGNPLSYHPRHRIETVRYLHPCLGDSKFVLDHVPLSKLEKQAISEHCPFKIRPQQELQASISSSVNSCRLGASVDASIISDNSSSDVIGCLERSQQKSKKKRNVREAIITDDKSETAETLLDSTTASPYLGTLNDHLETKKQILALREKFGENYWLSSQAESFVRDIMGFQPADQPVVSSPSSIGNVDHIAISYQQDYILKNVACGNNSKTESHEYSVQENVLQIRKDSQEDNNKIENDESDQDKTLQADKDPQMDETKIDETSEECMSISQIEKTIQAIPEPPYDAEEETGQLYLVERKRDNNEVEELFLILTDDDIKERDALTGKVKYSWSMNAVLSCVLGRSEPTTVDIIFDTTRKDRENRRYIVELEDAKTIVSTIEEKIKRRPLLLKVFKCMKCSTHFSQDSEDLPISTLTFGAGTSQLKCPTCKSTLVIETDELSTLEVENNESVDPVDNTSTRKQFEPSTNTKLQHSESYSSIGGMESGAISITTSLVHSDSYSQAHVCCSATSLEESRESTPSNALNKKHESDIEILSNPSQSSIEVLDDASKTHVTPHRKRSEERRTAIAPSLLTIPDTAPIPSGLTESSSSGSLTDSICTAYENRPIKQSTVEERSIHSSSEKDGKYTPVTNLTSMLGGLLQSIKTSGNKPLLLKSDEASHYVGNNIQYSYTDFGSIDHRIKLHIILNVLEQKNEELILLLRADILTQSAPGTFPGCLVLSTSKVYILRIEGIEGEDPQSWLRKECSWTMDRLRSFGPLPYFQGIVVELQQPNKSNEVYSTVSFLCILQDPQRTTNFLFYVSGKEVKKLLSSEYAVFDGPENDTDVMHNLLEKSINYQEGDLVRFLALYSNATLKCESNTVPLKLSGLIVSSSVLLILEDNVHWLLPGSNELPAVLKEQAMCNLISVEQCGTTLTLKFLDEVAGLEDTWFLAFLSSNAAEAVINAIQPPWEELFSIPLQIHIKST